MILSEAVEVVLLSSGKWAHLGPFHIYRCVLAFPQTLASLRKTIIVTGVGHTMPVEPCALPREMPKSPDDF